jgi:Rod binding domain-containing protein
VFATILLKEMRATLEPGTLFGSDPNDVYGGIFDLFLGQHIAESGGFGLADMINAYLQSS